MKWTSAVSDNPSLRDAIDECLAEIEAALDEQQPNLVFVFPSAHHAPAYGIVSEMVRDRTGDVTLVGCSGGGVIGAGRELEHRPGFAIAAAHLPGVDIAPFHFEDGDLPDADAPPHEWEGLVNTSPDKTPEFVLLADPFSVRGQDLLMGLDFAFPASSKIGGLASGGNQQGGNALFLNADLHNSGVVGVALHGNVTVDTVVAQGCRPIGSPMIVTSCHRNILAEVDGRAPLEVLREIYDVLNDRDRELAQHSLFLGVVMDELVRSPQLGDFLVRNIIGSDGEKGTLAVGELLAEGQIVQFHQRDAMTSSQDLESLLTKYQSEHPVYADSGALLFQCLGRGSYLFGRPDHDTDMFREKVGNLPLTGFFCNGEIGPVGGSTFLHGYTSSFGIFRPRAAAG